ncbi:tetratricopeptide repeat protein, partial [Acinetobacter baumannii]
KALAIRRAALGDGHVATATAFHNLGNICKFAGELDRAQENLQQAVDLRIKLFGENRAETAASVKSLGDVYRLKAD